MAEKLYRIKPLVFVRGRARAWAAGADYYVSKRGEYYFASIDVLSGVGDLPGVWPTRQRAVTACQRDYESRLIASRVIEPVDESEARRAGTN